MQNLDFRLPFYYCVEPDKLYAGEYPTWFDGANTQGRFRTLLGLGVSFFVDLTEEEEEIPYQIFLNKEAGKIERKIDCRRLPIIDRSAPSPEYMREILDTIDTAHAAGQAVYTHCRAGIGRTGTVIGCYLVRHGMSGEEALKTIARMRKGIRDGILTSPHSRDQKELVLNWQVGQ